MGLTILVTPWSFPGIPNMVQVITFPVRPLMFFAKDGFCRQVWLYPCFFFYHNSSLQCYSSRSRLKYSSFVGKPRVPTYWTTRIVFSVGYRDVGHGTYIPLLSSSELWIEDDNMCGINVWIYAQGRYKIYCTRNWAWISLGLWTHEILMRITPHW